MKPISKFMAVAVVIAMTGCSDGAGKFVGKWHRVKGMGTNKVVIIEKKGDHYEMYPDKQPDDFMAFSYDKEHDMLTASQQGMFLDIKYDKDTKHLKVGERGGGGLYSPDMELEKVN